MPAPKREGLRMFSRSSSSEHIMGVVVREITREMRMDTDKVTVNSRNIRPTMPPANMKGMNTATNDRLMDTTVKPTSRAPSRAALMRDMPASIWRVVFSMTTMASSTHEAGGHGERHQGKLSRV